MIQNRLHTLSPRKLAVLFAFVAASGCSLATDVSTPGLIAEFGGDGQTAATSTALPNPLQVLVANQLGERLNNITVTWTILTGGGALSATTSVTDASGIAEVNYTTGSTAGDATIQARVGGVPPITFTIHVT